MRSHQQTSVGVAHDILAILMGCNALFCTPWRARLCRAVPVRSAEEVEGLRQACLAARKILDAAHAAVRPGVTTEEIDRVVIPHPCLTLQIL